MGDNGRREHAKALTAAVMALVFAVCSVVSGGFENPVYTCAAEMRLPQDEVPEASAPADVPSAGTGASQDLISESPVSADSAAEQEMSSDKAGLTAVSGVSAVSGQSVSGQTVSGQTLSGQSVSGQTVSGQTLSEQTVSQVNTASANYYKVTFLSFNRVLMAEYEVSGGNMLAASEIPDAASLRFVSDNGLRFEGKAWSLSADALSENVVEHPEQVAVSSDMCYYLYYVRKTSSQQNGDAPESGSSGTSGKSSSSSSEESSSSGSSSASGSTSAVIPAAVLSALKAAASYPVTSADASRHQGAGGTADIHDATDTVSDADQKENGAEAGRDGASEGRDETSLSEEGVPLAGSQFVSGSEDTGDEASDGFIPGRLFLSLTGFAAAALIIIFVFLKRRKKRQE